MLLPSCRMVFLFFFVPLGRVSWYLGEDDSLTNCFTGDSEWRSLLKNCWRDQRWQFLNGNTYFWSQHRKLNIKMLENRPEDALGTLVKLVRC